MSAERTRALWLAIAITLLALLLFDAMGLIIKRLSPRYSAAELSAWRNFFGILPCILVLATSAEWHAKGRRLAMRQWPLALSRGMIAVFAQLMYYLSLGRIDFATATTISYAMAPFTTALAVPILGERVGWMRWSAVGIGFVGVIMVMGPGRAGFSSDALLPLGAAVGYALSTVLVRRMDDDVPSALVNLYGTGAATVGTVILCLATTGFSPVASMTDLGWIVAMGISGGAAVLCLVISFRMTEPSNLAPFNYFGIPLAFVLGWLFFAEAPWDDLFPGVILIVAAGLLIVWRERRAMGR